MSSSAHSPTLVGKVVTIAGRSTPGSRPSTNRPHAIIAPELPADTTASASPDLHRSKHMRIDDFFFCFTAIDGASCIVMTSGAWRIVDLLGARAQALELRAHAWLVTDDDDVDPLLADGGDDPLDLDARRAVRSHRVNGDRRQS